MTAVVAYVRDDNAHEPPPDLMTALYCRKFGTLPRSGGLRDQAARQMRRMSTALVTFDAFMAYQQASKPLEWRKHNRRQADWIDEVKSIIGEDDLVGPDDDHDQ